MRGAVRACALVALASAGACLDVPPYQPCAGDRDCDGWPAVAQRPEAADCDDRNPAINPSVEDDPATPADEDCLPGAPSGALTRVLPLARGWAAGELVLEFDSTPRMPSSLRLGAAELLAGNGDSCARDEQLAGVSLYPAFAVHGNTVQSGALATTRGGPALATTRVTWSQAVPQAATGFGCDAAVTVTGTIDFTVQPSGRVVRHDRVTVDQGVATCAGCANATGGMPIFTSYATFVPTLDRYQIGSAPSSSAFPAPGAAGANLPAPGAPTTGCVSGPSGAGPQVGLAWTFPTPIRGMRARTTDDTHANHAVVVDWVNTGAVAAATYELVTALEAETDGAADCSTGLRTAMNEFARPAPLTGLSFEPARGVYRLPTEPGAGVVFDAVQAVEHGAVIELPNFTDFGATVWRSSGADYVRLRRGQDYLVQRDADGTTVVYLPAIAAGTTIDIAGPGGEPPP